MRYKHVLFLSFISFVGCCLALAEGGSVNGQLAANRRKIDEIDRQIVVLINQRAAVVDRIGRIKAAAGLPVAAPNREQEVLTRVATIGQNGPFAPSRLQAIYSTLLTQMREWEEEQHPSKK